MKDSKYFKFELDGVKEDRIPAVLNPKIMEEVQDQKIAALDSTGPGRELDILYLFVEQALDLNLAMFQTTIKFVKNAQALEEAAFMLFGQKLRAGAFYVVAEDKLYVDCSSASNLIIAHEIAHALIAKYFVQPVSEKIHEVLAGYVEWELRKL